MTQIRAWLNDERHRVYLYNVGLGVVALLVGYGVMAEEHALLWVGLLAPLLGVARTYVPRPGSVGGDAPE